MHMRSQTWEDSDVVARLKRSAILEPGDESRRVGLDLTQHRGGTAQSYCHLLCRTIGTRTSNSRRYWQKKEQRFTLNSVNHSSNYHDRLKSLVCLVCTQDVEVEVPTAIPCTVRCQAAVPASVCNLGARDLEETAVR